MTQSGGGMGPESFTDYSKGRAESPFTHARIGEEQHGPDRGPVGGVSTVTLVIGLLVLLVALVVVLLALV